jgi:6-phosphogluconolactonase
MDVLIHDDRQALAHAVAGIIAVRAAEGPMTLGLAGGSTPADAYRALRDHDIDWNEVWLWLSDERWVAHEDDDSNGRMALENLPAAAGPRLARPRYSAYLDPEDAAAHYEADLRSHHEDGTPDIVLLGMGTDGHTASLFPGTAALEADPHRWFVANHVPSLDVWRLTATPSLLQAARRTLLLVAGAEKAGVLAEVVNGEDGRYPIQLLRSAAGEVTVLCDAAAASRLSI